MSAALLNSLARIPFPIFGNARLATKYLSQKSKVLPRLAPWAVPGLIGAVWFVWPAVTDSAKISLGLMKDPEAEEAAVAAAEAADKAKVASTISKEETQGAVAKAITPPPEQLKLADSEASGDFSHLEADKENEANEDEKDSEASVDPVTVTELASRSYIKEALENPFKPESVLTFFMGVDYASDTSQSLLRDGSVIHKDMAPLWFAMGDKEYDDLCQHFADVIREGAQTSFPEWDNTVDSKMAKIVLFDQLSRNCFRGTSEAYAYDHLSKPLARELAQYAMDDDKKKYSFTGEMYGIYADFCIATFMHSETLEDHEYALKLIEWGRSVSPQLPWDMIKAFELEHKAVVDRFGRYPHRNKQKNRESTKEEMEWLSRKDLPSWAK